MPWLLVVTHALADKCRYPLSNKSGDSLVAILHEGVSMNEAYKLHARDKMDSSIQSSRNN